ncbi:hypothetical protein [Galbibacter sp. PAP.153]|uniref:hypothetical protein n=1 Tax=Galbibacter sp. PAP.153 TaxID=3104623 RepID=UPI0030097306
MKKTQGYLSFLILLIAAVYAQAPGAGTHDFLGDVPSKQQRAFESANAQNAGYATNEFLSISFLFSHTPKTNETPTVEKAPFNFVSMPVSIYRDSAFLSKGQMIHANYIALQKNIIQLFPFHSFW